MSKVDPMASIGEFLRVHGWEEHEQALLDYGISVVKDLIYLEVNDLASLNLKPIVRRGIMTEVEALKIARDNTQDFLTSAKSNFSDEKILMFAQTGDPDKTDHSGNCALHFLIARNRITVIESLPPGKLNPNIRNNKGETPLHWAARAKVCPKEKVCALIKLPGSEKLDVAIKDNEGHTAVQIASMIKSAEVVQELCTYTVIKRDGKPGKLDVAFWWYDFNDLDIHLLLPSTEVIFYRNRVLCGGKLDIDANADNHVEDPIEHITFENDVPTGSYKVMLDYYCKKSNVVESPFQLMISVNSKPVALYHGICKLGDKLKDACTFDWNGTSICNLRSTGYMEEDFRDI